MGCYDRYLEAFWRSFSVVGLESHKIKKTRSKSQSKQKLFVFVG